MESFPPKSFRIPTRKTHANAHLTNGFPLPNLQRLPLGRVPSRDKRSRGLRFHRNKRVILLGRDREGLLRLSIVHRLGVLPGTCKALFFVSFCSRLSTRDDEEKFVSSRSCRCEAAVATVWDDDDDFRSVFARAVFERINTDVWGKRSPSRFCLARVTPLSYSLTLSLSLSVTQTTTKQCLCFMCL